MALILGKIKPWQSGLASGGLSAAVFLVGWLYCGESSFELGLAVTTAAAIGAAVYLLQRAGLRAWLVVFLAGTLLGLESAIELLLEVSFERQCFVALATAIFWLILGFSIGAVAEFVRLLHKVSHRAAQGVEDRLKDQYQVHQAGRRTRA